MAECPYCRREMEGDDVIMVLPQRQRRVYSTVAAAGPQGVKKDALALAMYAEDQKPTTARYGVLRVVIHGLNQNLASVGKRIVGRGGSYFLTVH